MYHCLIDTGALVMGFTNEEVAKVMLKMLRGFLYGRPVHFCDVWIFCRVYQRQAFARKACNDRPQQRGM